MPTKIDHIDINGVDHYFQDSDQTTEVNNLKSNVDLTRLLNFGVLNLLDYVALEKGRFDTDTGNKVASDTQARNVSPLSLPVGTVINLLPIIGTGINIYNYNTDGTYISRTPIADIPADGSYYYTTTAPVINFAFYIDGNTLDEAYNAFKMTITTPSIYNEKRLSVLGNSISSYRNMGLAGAGFYPSGNVYTSGQLYWAQVKSALHLTLDTLNAYSQTMVTGKDNSMSMTTRGTNLGTPDIILFEGGTNDIYGNVESGQWSGDDVLDLSATLTATWSQGRIDGTAGTDRDSETIIRTALITVSVGEPLVFYTNEIVANAYIYKYGADDSYIGYDSFPINANNGYKYTYSPTSAKIRICLTNSDYSAINPTFAENLTVKLPYATEFIPAYTKAVKQIQTKYPNAKLICISPAFIEKNSTGREYCTIENIQRICEAEKLVCEYLGVPFIDCRKLKMNSSNIGSYTVDGLHWNYQFHSAVASAIIKELS